MDNEEVEVDGLGNALQDPYSFRLIFLDMDEVLNSTKTMLVSGRIPHIRHNPVGSTLQDEIEYVEALDQYAMPLLALLCKTTGARIVISSAWRIGYTADELMRIFSILPFGQYIIGRTPNLNLPNRRGAEIDYFCSYFDETNIAHKDVWPAWEEDKELLTKEIRDLKAKDNRPDLSIERFAIIDDSTDMLPRQKHHFVQINPMDGLILSNLVQVGKILTGNKDFGTLDMSKAKKY